MPSSIQIDQAVTGAGTPGKARDDLIIGQVVTCLNATVEGSYLWTLVDTPLRSGLIRGTTGSSATFNFTPDVKGTYIVTLRVNGSPFDVDNDQTFGAVVTTGAKELGWRYLGAQESNDDDNTLKAGLGFVGDLNTRGWATERDLQLEQIELAAYEAANSVILSPGPGTGLDRYVRLDPATGRLDTSVVPAATGSSNPSSFTAGTQEFEDVLGVPRVLGGFQIDGDDLALGRVLSLQFLGSYTSMSGAGNATLQLYDMGAPADGPQPGVLRSEVSIPAPADNRVYSVSQNLTSALSPGVNADEIHDVPHKYEVRMLLDSVAVGDTMAVLWGGVVSV